MDKNSVIDQLEKAMSPAIKKLVDYYQGKKVTDRMARAANTSVGLYKGLLHEVRADKVLGFRVAQCITKSKEDLKKYVELSMPGFMTGGKKKKKP